MVLARILPKTIVLSKFTLYSSNASLDRFYTITFDAIQLVARRVKVINVMEILTGRPPSAPTPPILKAIARVAGKYLSTAI